MAGLYEREMAKRAEQKTIGDVRNYEQNQWQKSQPSLWSEMQGAISDGAGKAWDDFKGGAAYLGDKAQKGFNEALGGDDASGQTRDRRAYAISQGLSDLTSAGANNDIDRLNIMAANLGYGGRAKKPTGQDFADRWYNEKIAGRAEKNQDYNDKYVKMLMKAFEQRIDKQGK